MQIPARGKSGTEFCFRIFRDGILFKVGGQTGKDCLQGLMVWKGADRRGSKPNKLNFIKNSFFTANFWRSENKDHSCFSGCVQGVDLHIWPSLVKWHQVTHGREYEMKTWTILCESSPSQVITPLAISRHIQARLHSTERSDVGRFSSLVLHHHAYLVAYDSFFSSSQATSPPAKLYRAVFLTPWRSGKIEIY